MLAPHWRFLERIGRLDAPITLGARVGIATGIVVVGDLVGSGEAQERGVGRQSPNLAARLGAMAPPCGVLITEATRRLRQRDLLRVPRSRRHQLEGL